jgi:ElaB/YqjD/DUF883 family membrane-anchored ribosome-binding protein
MAQSPEELNQDIASTRERLSRDVDELSDRVSPARIVERRKEAARSRIGSIRDAVMGTAEDVRDRATSAGGSAGDSAGDAVQQVRRTAEGNPLAAGLVAFGAGMLLSAMFPASEAEQRVARQAREQAGPVLDEARSMGQEVGQHVKDVAQEAAQQVGDTAKESAQHLKDEGQSAAQQVKDAGGA